MLNLMKRRLDLLLVERGLTESRVKAHALIMAGDVLVNERVIDRPSTQVREDVRIHLRHKPLFVSRGGIKLAHALDLFHIDVNSLVALDVGASAGGFTDCLLKRGASRVYAVDVGYGQLDYRLRVEHRVVIMERLNARYPFALPELVDLATVDLSFISLEKVVPNITRLVKSGGNLICLVKPQFELGRAQVGRGGLVKDPLLHARALGRFISWAIEWGGMEISESEQSTRGEPEKGFRLIGLTPSPIPGASGNREFFVLLRV
jgi:23S rRNA (cytidine1920-2'-O)/16S rRNA (cytidine1409-2'-O)-methyltransferase